MTTMPAGWCKQGAALVRRMDKRRRTHRRNLHPDDTVDWDGDDWDGGDVRDWIAARTGLPPAIVGRVLDAETEWMRRSGGVDR